MKSVVLTGGIATGKSTVVRLVREFCTSVEVFDSDACVKALLEEDEVVREKLRSVFGEEIFFEGRLDRAMLRQRVFADDVERLKLEEILHPLVRAACGEARQNAERLGVSLFVADIPLYFEKGFELEGVVTVLVAAGREAQVRRIRGRNRYDDELIERILATQWLVERKMELADVVLWNEGTQEVLYAQVLRMLRGFGVVEVLEDEVVIGVEEMVLELPERVMCDDFREKSHAELQDLVEKYRLDVRVESKGDLVFALLQFFGQQGVELFASGVLEISREGAGILRDEKRSFRPSADDLFVPGQMIQSFGLKTGNRLVVKVRGAREREKSLAVAEILEIEGVAVAEYEAVKDFEVLTPMFPDQRVILERADEGFVSCRLLDLIAPLGKGQRGILVAPPRGGKTILLKQIARAIRLNHPEAILLILLLDERPEEVTDFEETIGGQVFASTFDETPKRHAQVADMVLERAKRLVERGEDVILLLDSLTRLARGHNSSAQGNGPIGSGGVNPQALQKSRKFFGAARNVEEGGSLTILATALVETESRLDEVIFEEFKGTGNMEVKLDRELAERRMFPAIHIGQSGTRNDDRLYHPDEFVKVLELRRQLAPLPIGDALETLLNNLQATQSNTELLLRGLR